MVAVFVRRALAEAGVMRSLSMPTEATVSTVTASYPSPVPALVAAPSAALSLPSPQRPSPVRSSRFSILKTLKRTFRKYYS